MCETAAREKGEAWYRSLMKCARNRGARKEDWNLLISF